jgi:hypothetical protein
MERFKTPDIEFEIFSIIQDGPLLKIEFTQVVDLKGKNLSKIEVLTSGGILCTSLLNYTTIYKTEGNKVILSNDGSVYSEPEQPTEPSPVEPYIPTLEEVQAGKIRELSFICSREITKEFISTAFDGVTPVLYDCELTDQSRVNGLVSIAQLRLSGLTDEPLKWKNAEQEACVEWTPEQILALGLDMKRHIEGNIERYDNLKIYVKSLSSIDEVKAVTWDMEIA